MTRVLRRFRWPLALIALLVAVAGIARAAEAGAAAVSVSLSAVQAAVLGVVEGLTEYLPVSSTGHLLLAKHLMGLGHLGDANDALDAYLIVIQAGAILAVVLIYWERLKSIYAGIVGRDAAGRRLGLNILVAFLPAAVIGFLFDDYIKQYLFGIWPVTVAWVVGGVVILLVGAGRQPQPDETPKGKALEELTAGQSLAIGGIQCLAMWPGVSRSLATILGGLLVGLTPMAAVEFSFLLGLITLTAATGYDALKHGDEIVRNFGIVNPLIGFAVAAISAFLAVKWMVGYLNKHGLAVFGHYRIALGLITAAALLLLVK